jgi:hypothetical protein
VDRRPRALVRAWLLAAAALLLVGPTVASAADPEPSPSPAPSVVIDAELATASPSASPSASTEPTATPDPTAEPTPDPTAEPTPDPTAEPTPTAQPTPTPAPTPRTEYVLTYRRSAIVRQYTNYWCVPAATQTMWNLVRNQSNTSYSRQSALYTQTRAHNRYSYRTRGNDVQGWAWALRRYTYQPYWARAYVSKTAAIASIVESLDRTRHPVGITVKAGSHAWVVLGYRASVDPADPSKRTILGFYVTGPLGSPTDPYPYKYLTLAAFSKVYTRYHEWQRRVIWEGLYVVVNH